MMDTFTLTKPVVFFIFKRPETTKKVFSVIRQIRPSKLYIFADGPRDGETNEAEKCRQTRKIVENIDWPCEVYREYAPVNLGLERRVISALNTVFAREEDAIILEDDCLPDPTFFRFCEELLDRYRDDNRVMSISGSNFHFGRHGSKESYHFSRFPSPWGWATWKRAWALYDEQLSLWPEVQKGNWLKDILHHKEAEQFWWRVLQDCYFKGPLYAWDYVWKFSCWVQNGLAITPNTNMISNIGFGADATHTKSADPLEKIQAQAMHFPLVHPKIMVCNEEADLAWKDFRYGKTFSREAYLKKLIQVVAGSESLAQPLIERSISRVALFGTLNISLYLAQHFVKNGIEVVAFLDNNQAIEGTVMNGVKVFTPQKLASQVDDYHFDAVISTVLGEHEMDILSQLAELFGDKARIISWIDLVAWQK